MRNRSLVLLAPLLLVGTALPAAAAGAQKTVVVSQNEFHDLPGVHSRPKGTDQNGYKCTTVVRQTDRIGDIDFMGRSGMPVLSYHCEKNGFVFEGARPPNSAPWIPGLNPHHLPK